MLSALGVFHSTAIGVTHTPDSSAGAVEVFSLPGCQRQSQYIIMYCTFHLHQQTAYSWNIGILEAKQQSNAWRFTHLGSVSQSELIYIQQYLPRLTSQA